MNRSAYDFKIEHEPKTVRRIPFDLDIDQARLKPVFDLRPLGKRLEIRHVAILYGSGRPKPVRYDVLQNTLQ